MSVDSLRTVLQNLGHEVYIITTNSPHIKEEKDPYVIRFKGVPLPFKVFKNYRWILKYKSHLPKIKALNLDIIHIHTEFGLGLLGIYAKQQLNLPLVYTMHTMYVSFFQTNNSLFIKTFRPLMIRYADRIVKRCLINADFVIFPTQKALDFVDKRYQIEIKANKLHYEIVPTGLNLDHFYPQKHSFQDVDNLKNELNLKDYFVCLYVGRVSAEKEINYLIKAFALFNQHHQQSKFLIIGDGPDQQNLKKQVAKLKLTDKVIFLGFIHYDRLGLYYQLGDVFLNASLFETQGLTYIEALSAGLPVLVRYDVCLTGVIQDGQNGLFYHNQQELITKLIHLYNHPNYCQTLSRAALKSVAHFNQAIFGKTILKIFTHLINKNNFKLKNLL